ncbi:MAG: methionyl-tRNA formyltransferase [Patescibacteria group bacterium]|nr:methionyl-tRNA formyltransferase [Patescibacteria group bacterium]
MKFVFFGTPEFAKIVLEKLLENGYVPSVLVCNPDRPTGRKKIIIPPPTKILIQSNAENAGRIKIMQPEKLDEDFKNKIKELEPDFFVIAAYAKIITQDVIDIPKFGIIGVHPSLLPKYRGSSPIQTAILDDEKETGVTLYFVDSKVDHGPIIAQKNLEINDMNYSELQKKLAGLGGNLLAENFQKLIKQEIKPRIQIESDATFTKKFMTHDGFIDPADLENAQNDGGDLAKSIYQKIKALNPEPGVWTEKSRFGGGKRIKILEATLNAERKLKLKKIQIEGKNPVILN